MLKVGLVGAGGISRAHIPAWIAMEETELVALCDIRTEQMEEFPDQRHYTDFEEMLEKELTFSPAAQHEISVLTAAVHEILDLSLQAFQTGDPEIIRSVEPL